MLRRTLLGGTAALSVYLSHRTFAQKREPILPSVKLLAGFPAGGSIDATARMLADAARGDLAELVVVDNKPGAGGRMAAEMLARAAPDGSTLLVAHASAMTLYPHVYKQMPYELGKDIVPLAPVSQIAFGLGVGPMVPAEVKDIKGLIRWVNENSAKASCGSPGTGSMPDFLAQRLEKLAGMKLSHVPYRGSAPAIQDLLAGQVSCVMSPIGDFVPYIAGGKLRVLGATTEKRSKFLPDAPTFAEQGLPQLTATEYYGVYAPVRTPVELQDRLAAAIYRAVQVTKSIEMLDRMVMDPVGLSRTEFAKYLMQERDVWRDAVRDANFKPLD